MSVCEGYTNLTVALLRAAGIPAKKVVGYAGKDFGVGELTATVSSENITKNHAWTEACIDGRWILMDTTWDSGNRFENGTITASDGCESHKYFDISQALISYNHVVIDANNYAELFLYIGYPQMWNGSGWRDCSSDALTPYVYQGATYAPLANLIWEMGGSVAWDTITDPGWNKIICEINGHNVQMWLNYGKFYVDGRECIFAVPPSLSGESIIVEIGVLFRAMGYDVTWDGVRDQWQPGRVTIAYAT